MSLFTTEKVISVQDLDNLVEKTYGRPYSFQQQDGCKERQRVKITVPADDYDFENESVPEVVNGNEMGVSFKVWLERDPTQLLNELRPDWDSGKGSLSLWWTRNFYPTLESVINDLHDKGLIEAGDYTIDIDW